MECFENLFMRSCARQDGTCPSISPQMSQLHINALLSWALLLTICSGSQIKEILQKWDILPTVICQSLGVFFAMFYSLTHILSCADFCPNFQGCWRVTMSIWGLLQEKQSLCFLSWPETWTRWVLFKGIPLSSSVCVLLSFICVRPNIFIPLFFFSCHRSLILTNWTNSATNWTHWPQTVTSTEPRRTRKSNDLCSGTFSRLLRWVGVRQIRFVGIWGQLAHGKN